MFGFGGILAARNFQLSGSKSHVSWGRSTGICPNGEFLESGAFCHVTVQSSLKSSQYWSMLSLRVSPRLEENRSLY